MVAHSALRLVSIGALNNRSVQNHVQFKVISQYCIVHPYCA